MRSSDADESDLAAATPSARPAPAHPMSHAIVGVRDAGEARAIYADALGFELLYEFVWPSRVIAELWGVEVGRARGQVFAPRAGEAGAVLCLAFDGPGTSVAAPGDRGHRGLWNLNFLVDEAAPAAELLVEAGCRPWSEITRWRLDSDANRGQPVEIILDTPSGPPFCLLQLEGGTETQLGALRESIWRTGRSPRGFSAVVTSSHAVADADQAQRFYAAFGYEVLVETVQSNESFNKLTGRPPGATTRARFLQAGDCPLGKIALSQGLNFSLPDRSERAAPPNHGYLGHVFVVPSLDEWAPRLEEAGAPFSPLRVRAEFPPFGVCDMALARVPASGAAALVVAAS